VAETALELFWRGKGLGRRAARALALAKCANLAEVRQLGRNGLMLVPDCAKHTTEEIGRVLFDEDWMPPVRLPHLRDETLIRELTARGYTVKGRGR